MGGLATIAPVKQWDEQENLPPKPPPPPTERPPSLRNKVDQYLRSGYEQAKKGVQEIGGLPSIQASDPYSAQYQLSNQAAQGLSDVVRGTGQLASPLAIPFAAAAPVPALLGLGAATGAQQGVQKLGEAASAPPGVVSLAGDVAGGLTGLGLPGALASPAEDFSGAFTAAPSALKNTFAEAIQQPLQDAADAALQRVRDRGGFQPGAQMNALVPLDNMKDMAIWGAAKLARGVTDFKDWSNAMIADAGPSIAPELQKLWQSANKVHDDHLAMTGANQFPTTANILDMYHQGVEGQDWYKYARPELQKIFGHDTDLFIDFLAATSPNNTVPGNLTQALKAYQAYKNNIPFEALPEGKGVGMRTTIDNLYRAVAGQELSGPKVGSFSKNLKGDAEPVTVDRWMLNALGLNPTGEETSPSTKTYKFADYWLTQIAHEKGIEPRQLQAALWKAVRESAGESAETGASFNDMLNERLAADPTLADTLARMRASARPRAPGAGAGVRRANLYSQLRANMLRGLQGEEGAYNPKAPTAMTGTMETATNLTPEGAAAAKLYGQLDPNDPLRAGYEQANRDAMHALALPQGQSPSLLSQLKNALTGRQENFDPLIGTEGTHGTFEGAINPNIHFPMQDMTTPQREAMLSILGQDTHQAAMAASHFKAIPPNMKGDTYSVFLHNLKADPAAINEFSNRMGFPVNARQYSNGTLVDVNVGGFNAEPGFKPPTDAQVEAATEAAFGKKQPASFFKRQYSSDYIPQEQYQDKINAYLQKPEPQVGLAGRPGQAGNPPGAHGDLARIRGQIQSAARVRDQAFARWTRDAQAELQRRQNPPVGPIAQARGGAVKLTPQTYARGGLYQQMRGATLRSLGG
jgi:hypothetical protein